jgi:hypothetical protein
MEPRPADVNFFQRYDEYSPEYSGLPILSDSYPNFPRDRPSANFLSLSFFFAENFIFAQCIFRWRPRGLSGFKESPDQNMAIVGYDKESLHIHRICIMRFN